MDDALEHNALDVVQLQDMYRFCFDYSITVDTSIKLAMEGNPVKLRDSTVTLEESKEIIETMLDRIQTRLEEKGGTPEFMFNHVPQIETVMFEE